jgi:chromosome segregation ATPase
MSEILLRKELRALRRRLESLKAERDALAIENQALKSKAAELVHEASEVYSAYNATIREPDGDFMDMQTLYEMKCIETPATSAALAAIQAQGVEKFVTKVAKQLREAGGERGYNLVDWCEYADHLEDRGEKFAIELREAK